MSAALHQAILAVPEEAWEAEKSEAEAERHCAEVPFVPGEKTENKNLQPLRYVAVRVRKRQGERFADGSTVKYFAVVSNIQAWSMARLLEWHQEKAGTIERVNDILKNDLGAGVMPCGRFGANAAWLRLTHNVLVALKRLALPPALLAARPKRLRFLIFHSPRRIVHHARRAPPYRPLLFRDEAASIPCGFVYDGGRAKCLWNDRWEFSRSCGFGLSCRKLTVWSLLDTARPVLNPIDPWSLRPHTIGTQALSGISIYAGFEGVLLIREVSFRVGANSAH
jgi:hypothetical protein